LGSIYQSLSAGISNSRQLANFKVRVLNSLNINRSKKHKDHSKKVKKKELPETPSGTLPWSARRIQECTLCEGCTGRIMYIFLSSLQGFFFTSLR
jgi:hypothetical protein